MSTLDDDECAMAWRATGAALRTAHSIRFPDSYPGLVVGEKVRLFDDGSWGDFQIHQVLRHAHGPISNETDWTYAGRFLRRIRFRSA